MPRPATSEDKLTRALVARYDRIADALGSAWPDETPSEAAERKRTELAVVALAAPGPGERVVDVGTGRRGRYAIHCARAGATVLALDLSSAVLAAAEREARMSGTIDQISFAVAHGVRLPAGSCTADLVVCSQVLEYWPEPSAQKLIGEIARVLVPGGRAVIDLPDGSNRAARDVMRDEIADGVAFYVLGASAHERMIARSGLGVVKSQKADIETLYLVRKPTDTNLG